MFEKLDELEAKYVELERSMADPEVVMDQPRFQKIAKAHAELEDVVSCYRRYKAAGAELDEARRMLAGEGGPLDAEFKEFLAGEVERLKKQGSELEEHLKLLLLPKDPNDARNVMMEIRAGAGGEEAALFAGNLLRMYSKYAELRGWRTEVMSSSPTDLGGFKEIIFMVEGRGAYSRLKFESGVHRVQRVPETEASGRIHTSTSTVAVLPEAEEVEVEVDPEDLRVDVYRSTGPGGQSVNTTDSAVRITHIPTGLVVTCQDEKSQHKNKDKAMRILRSRLLAMYEEQQRAEVAQARRSQVGTGDRSERIRTYNFPQGRVSDHRIGLTLYRLDSVLAGNLDDLIDPLIAADRGEALKAMAQ